MLEEDICKYNCIQIYPNLNHYFNLHVCLSYDCFVKHSCFRLYHFINLIVSNTLAEQYLDRKSTKLLPLWTINPKNTLPCVCQAVMCASKPRKYPHSRNFQVTDILYFLVEEASRLVDTKVKKSHLIIPFSRL